MDYQPFSWIIIYHCHWRQLIDFRMNLWNGFSQRDDRRWGRDGFYILSWVNYVFFEFLQIGLGIYPQPLHGHQDGLLRRCSHKRWPWLNVEFNLMGRIMEVIEIWCIVYLWIHIDYVQVHNRIWPYILHMIWVIKF